MSIANIAFEGDTVRLFTDTLVTRDNAASGLCSSKGDVSLNRKLAWTHRGQAYLGDFVNRLLEVFPGIDEALEFLEIDDFPKCLGQTLNKEFAFALTLAGYSQMAHDMIVVRLGWDLKASVLPVSRLELGRGVHLFPGSELPGALNLPPRASNAAMVKACIAQQAAWRKFKGTDMMGGLIHCTTITPAGASREVMGAYPDYAVLADRFGDPCRSQYEAWAARQRVAA